MFDNEVLSAHRLKSSFIYNLWMWSNVNIEDMTNSLVDFLTLLGCK